VTRRGLLNTARISGSQCARISGKFGVRISGTRNGNAMRGDERLFPQPRESGQLIVEMVRFEKTHHRGGASTRAALSLRRSDLIADIRARLRA
jgi:hypothetical protein